MNGVPWTGDSTVLAGWIVDASGPVDFDNATVMDEIESIRDSIVLPALSASRSRLVESSDVDILVESPTALDAITCALTIQKEMAARTADRRNVAQLHFRFGIDVSPREGADQSQAAQIASESNDDEILINAAVASQVRDRFGPKLVDCGLRQIGPAGEQFSLYRLSPEPTRDAKPAAPAQAPSRVQPRADVGEGIVLNGTYRIDSLIAQGGMGEVFKGHEIHSGGVVAVKLLRSDMSNSRVALGLFQKEAQILKEISHDAIVRYFLFSFEQSLQRHYLAMEFVDGVSLADLVKQGPLSFDDVSLLRRRIASALFVAHERGIIHRDMSPDNILLPGGKVAQAKVIDFGIARAAEIGGGTLIGGGFAGKYNYVSPEQLGLAGGDVTAKSDIYSLGLVLAECSLGTALDMNGTQAEVIEKRRSVPDLSRLDARLRPLVELMLHPDPAKRPPSMMEIADWSPQPSHQPNKPTRRADRSVRRAAAKQEGSVIPGRRVGRTLGLVGGGVLVAAVGIIGGVAFHEGWLARPPRSSIQFPHDASPAPLGPPPAEVHVKNDANPSQAAEDAGKAAPSASVGTEQQNTQSASTSPPTAQPDAMAAFARTFAPSDCFLIKPVQFTPTSALVEAFASSRDDFSAFDRDFSKRFGFSPDVAGYRVWSKQCPALVFAHKLPANVARNPFLLLKNMRVGSGQAISGEVRNAGDANLLLFLVHEDGTVSNMSDAIKRAGDGLTFDLPGDTKPNAVPQLLMVVASTQPLNAMLIRGTTADSLFAAMQKRITDDPSSIGIDIKVFLLGG